VKRAGACAVAAALAILQPLPVAAQGRPEIIFGGDVFDVTGAGQLDLGPLDPVLKPFRDSFSPAGGFAVEITINASGSVVACAPENPHRHPEAAQALCAHALEVGKFRPETVIAIDYTQATYLFHVYREEGHRNENGDEFYEADTYPLERNAVRFGDGEVPPANQRIAHSDLAYVPMDYPLSALQAEVSARVVVALTFDDTGNVERCRPIRSNSTARIAYETCKAAQRAFRLREPPDARPYVLSVNWDIP
jgi:hypothetical protein